MLYYHNEVTHAWTTDHKEAVAWYNDGYAVELNKVDPETGALEKCAEWVWQKDKHPPGRDMKMSLPGGHIRQIAQYTCGNMSFGINAKVYEQAFDKVYREIKRFTDKLYERDGNKEDCAEYYYDSLTAAWWAFEEIAGQQFGTIPQ